MPHRCAFCYRTTERPDPVPGWIEAIQGFLDRQPHPDRVDGIVPCDRRVFEDDLWICVVAREPLAEGHVRLVCRHHVSDLSQLRGGDEVEPTLADALRSTLMDDLIIAHDVVMGYDRRVVGAVVVSGALPNAHLYFDVVPVYRFDHGTLPVLGESTAVLEDIPPKEKRRHWERRREEFEEVGRRLREVAGSVIRSRPGRRRAGLRAGDED